MRFQQKDKFLVDIVKEKPKKTIPLNNFMGQERHILLFIDTENCDPNLRTTIPCKMVPKCTMSSW